MKKQDWTPREFGRSLRQTLEDIGNDAWWGAVRDYRRSLGEARFQEWFQKLLRRKSWRDQVLRQILRKVAVPSSRPMDTAEGVYAVAMRFLDHLVKR